MNSSANWCLISVQEWVEGGNLTGHDHLITVTGYNTFCLKGFSLMLILGINDSHDASACLLKDGKVLAAASEERYQRIKSTAGYPKNVIEALFAATGCKASDLDHVAVGTKFLVPTNLLNLNATFSVNDFFRFNEEYYYPIIYQNKSGRLADIFPNYKPKGEVHYPTGKIPFVASAEISLAEIESLQPFRRNHIAKFLGIDPAKIEFYDHHLCHAYYAYFSNPQRHCSTAVVTSDSGGDKTYCMVGMFENGKFREIHRNRNSLIGKFYTQSTLLLGMRPNEHEYKLMGLAPYASESYKKGPRDVFMAALQVDGLDFKKDPGIRDFHFYLKERLKTFRFDGIAGGVQDWVEDLLVEWFQNIHKETKCRDFVYAGGVANNVKANQKITEQSFVDSFFIPAGPGDENLSVGACYLAYEQSKLADKTPFEIAPMNNAYLGPKYDLRDIENFESHPFIQKHYDVYALDYSRVANLLASGEVIGVMFGEMEFGSRALGHRSLLADPSNPDMIRKINDLIKKRDFWMPFTPSILDECYDDYVINPKNIASNFMTITFDSTAKAKKDLVSAIHPYDHTARPQRVSEIDNPSYYRILKSFKERTGVGALLNTSLNIHGRPIVDKPIDLLNEILLEGGIELRVIVIDKRIFIKKL